jgi:hypothetical protein
MSVTLRTAISQSPNRISYIFMMSHYFADPSVVFPSARLDDSSSFY